MQHKPQMSDVYGLNASASLSVAQNLSITCINL